MNEPVVDPLFAEPRLAALYDTLHPFAPAEREFYLPLIMAAPAVLDVGCGTGALLKQARRAGHSGRLCGLDPAAAMLAQARPQADVEWMLGGAATMRVAHEFDLVLMTGHAFQVLLSDEELRAALAAIRGALKAGGRFAFDTRNPGARAWERWGAPQTMQIRDAEGNPVRVTLEVVTPWDGRNIAFIETYRCAQWGEALVSRSELRFLEARELDGYLRQAGFAIEAQFGDFERGPLTPQSPEIVTIAR